MKKLKSRFTIKWLKAAGMRALHTFLQTALGCLTIGTVITEVDWIYILEVAGTAALVSLAKSFIANVPELSECNDIPENLCDPCDSTELLPELSNPEADDFD